MECVLGGGGGGGGGVGGFFNNPLLVWNILAQILYNCLGSK